uniref:Ribosomal protein S14 n=1 Tax=Citrus reticulata TaxID=85571 RepID=K7PG97_CITRE|nr:ribosomal protein S14 [Citrus reticulata]
MARQSLIQREKNRHKLDQKYHLIRRSSKKETNKAPSLSDKWKIHGKLQSSLIVHLHDFLHQRCSLTKQQLTIVTFHGLAGPKSRKMVLACPFQGATRSSW